MLLSLSLPALSQKAADTADIRVLREEIVALRAEVAALRTEIQRLVPPDSTTADTSLAVTRTKVPVGTPVQYRCSKSGKKRHNPTCKYYNATTAPCGPHDGVSCKLCGG
jgi:hypothetical protein